MYVHNTCVLQFQSSCVAFSNILNCMSEMFNVLAVYFLLCECVCVSGYHLHRGIHVCNWDNATLSLSLCVSSSKQLWQTYLSVSGQCALVCTGFEPEIWHATFSDAVARFFLAVVVDLSLCSQPCHIFVCLSMTMAARWGEKTPLKLVNHLYINKSCLFASAKRRWSSSL